MGCDYYILKVLQIYKTNTTEYIEVEVERERGYFQYKNFDEDEDDYEENVKAYISAVLTPRMKPTVLYENGGFRKEMFEIKYKSLVEKEVGDWSTIERIVDHSNR